MECSNCRRDVLDEASFCGFCGSSLNAKQVIQDVTLPSVGFGEAISKGFSKYFTFSGRARRSEYWFWILFTSLVQLIPIVGGFIALATLIPSLAVGSRRLHDIGKSGWWQLCFIILLFVLYLVVILMLIWAFVVAFDNQSTNAGGIWMMALVSIICAFAGTAWWIVWMARQGMDGPNKYGPDPRKRSIESGIEQNT